MKSRSFVPIVHTRAQAARSANVKSSDEEEVPKKVPKKVIPPKVVVAPPTNRNVGPPPPAVAKRAEPAYKTQPASYNPTIATDVYSRTIDLSQTPLPQPISTFPLLIYPHDVPQLPFTITVLHDNRQGKYESNEDHLSLASDRPMNEATATVSSADATLEQEIPIADNVIPTVNETATSITPTNVYTGVPHLLKDLPKLSGDFGNGTDHANGFIHFINNNPAHRMAVSTSQPVMYFVTTVKRGDSVEPTQAADNDNDNSLSTDRLLVDDWGQSIFKLGGDDEQSASLRPEKCESSRSTTDCDTDTDTDTDRYQD